MHPSLPFQPQHHRQPLHPPQTILVTGPARSGKSEWAEQLAQQLGLPVVYLATSEVDPQDLEWQARLDQHRRRRPVDWQLWEVPRDLAGAIARSGMTLPSQHCLLVDSLGTWLANGLDQPESSWHQTVTQLLQVLAQSPHCVILVAEETGWGVVPAYPAGRRFRDRLGYLCRQVAAIADRVYLVNHGFALDLRQLGVPIAGDPH